MKPAQVLDSGRIVALAPALLSVKAAAVYCACSASLLNQMRATDARRMQRAEPIEGPQWVRLSYGIRYRVAALDAWIASTSTACGVCETYRREPKAAEVGA